MKCLYYYFNCTLNMTKTIQFRETFVKRMQSERQNNLLERAVAYDSSNLSA